MSDESEAELPDADESSDDSTDSESEAESTEESEPTEGIQDGDFVQLEYTIWTVDDHRLVDTTREDVAEEEDIETEDREFGPRTITIGAGHVFESVDEDLIGKDVGDSGSVTIPPVEAFGEHDPDQVRTVSVDRIPEDDRYPGGHVDIDGQHGHVETIIGGRARVNFNHPLAGEEIEYEYEITDIVTDRLERAQGLLSMYIDTDLDMWIESEEEEQTVYDDEGDEEDTEMVEVETLYIEAIPQLTMNQQWMFSKQQIAQELIDHVDVDRVIVQETLEGTGGMGGFGGLGMEELEAAMDDADIDEDIDTEELVDELGTETDLDMDELETEE